MPKEEMVNRFEEKFAHVKLIAIPIVYQINRARTKEEKNNLYKEVKPLFEIIQDFNNLEKIEFYDWFLHHYECGNDNDNDNRFKIINIENIKADMQSALEEVARYDSLIKCPDFPYYMIVDKPINNLYFALCYYLDSQDYIKTDDKEEFVIEFLNLFIECRDLLEEENLEKKDVKLLDDVEFKKDVNLMLTLCVGIFMYMLAMGIGFLVLRSLNFPN